MTVTLPVAFGMITSTLVLFPAFTSLGVIMLISTSCFGSVGSSSTSNVYVVNPALYASVPALSAVTVYEPALIISYSPVTVSPFILIVKSPSVTFSTSIVILSPTLASIIGVMLSSASLLDASNITVTI